MIQFRYMLYFVIAAIFLGSAQSALAQSGGVVKNPYTMTATASLGTSGVDVVVNITSINPQRYLLPYLIKEATAEPLQKGKGALKKVTLKNLSMVSGRAEFSLPGFQSLQQFHLRLHVKANGWHDEILEADCQVISQPDLTVKSIIAPQQVLAGESFTVQAVVGEITGTLSATATIILQEGASVISTKPGIFVASGAMVTVDFSDVSAAAPGTHTYTVTISGSNPPELTESNNAKSIAVQAMQLTTTQLQPGDMTYTFNSYDYAAITASTGTEYDHEVRSFWERSVLELKVKLPDGQSLGPVDQVSWVINTTNGTYDSYSVSNPVLPITSPDKGIQFSVSTGTNPVELTIFQDYTYSRIVDSWLSKNDVVGTPANVLRPEGFLEVTIQIRSGYYLFVGTTSLSVPLPYPVGTDSYSYTILGNTGEDGTVPHTELWTRIRTTTATTTTLAYTNVVGGAAVQVDRAADQLLPGSFELSQNYPNPFNPSTTIRFSVPKAGFVTLTVYDMLGREIGVLLSGNLQAGRHSTTWDASSLSSGMYIYRLRAGDLVSQKKLMLLK